MSANDDREMPLGMTPEENGDDKMMSANADCE
jgi:hypothetical protein